jgi:RNA polymerase sigma-70 factor (ECF subfamily)
MNVPPASPHHHEHFEHEALPHVEHLLGAALRLTRSRPAAEDLVQDTLLGAWRGFGGFQRGTNCKAWLFRIMLNLLTKRRQREGAARSIITVSLDAHDQLAEVLPDAGTGATATAVNASAAAAARCRFGAEEIFAALDALHEEHRAVLILAVVEGFTCKEIAAMRDLPIGTVMSRLSRARTQLRAVLTERETEGLPGRTAPGGGEGRKQA